MIIMQYAKTGISTFHNWYAYHDLQTCLQSFSLGTPVFFHQLMVLVYKYTQIKFDFDSVKIDKRE